MSENENEEFFYQLIRKNVKNINLRVKSDGSVVVSASPGVPEDYIDDFVYSKRSFIQKARRQMAQGTGSVSDWKPVWRPGSISWRDSYFAGSVRRQPQDSGVD